MIVGIYYSYMYEPYDYEYVYRYHTVNPQSPTLRARLMPAMLQAFTASVRDATFSEEGCMQERSGSRPLAAQHPRQYEMYE